MECGFVSHSMMILEKSSLYEEIHEVDHHEKLVFLAILQNLAKCLENVLVLMLMEYLLMEHPGQWKLTHENGYHPKNHSLEKKLLTEVERKKKLHLMEDWQIISSTIGVIE
ncbi:hypothetical protein Tco_0616445 [Tanacetum coccineum]